MYNLSKSKTKHEGLIGSLDAAVEQLPVGVADATAAEFGFHQSPVC